MFAPRGEALGSMRLSRVGVGAIADSFFWAPNSIAEGQKVRFCATQKPGRRGDRYPINCGTMAVAAEWDAPVLSDSASQ